jgi:malate dehydrogenase (oxaloacetate-decarboxylating)(NADP+)
VFPGIGLGAVAAKARLIPEAFFLTAARTLASLVSDEDLAAGSLYPRLRDIRQVSLAIATKVAEEARALGLTRGASPLDIEGYIYDP